MANRPEIQTITPEQAQLFWDSYGSQKDTLSFTLDNRFVPYVTAYAESAGLTSWQTASLVTQAKNIHDQARAARADMDPDDEQLSATSDRIYTLIEAPDTNAARIDLGDIAAKNIHPPLTPAQEPEFLRAYRALQESDPALATYVAGDFRYMKEIRKAYEGINISYAATANIEASTAFSDARQERDSGNLAMLDKAKDFYAALDSNDKPAAVETPSIAMDTDFEINTGSIPPFDEAPTVIEVSAPEVIPAEQPAAAPSLDSAFENYVQRVRANIEPSEEGITADTLTAAVTRTNQEPQTIDTAPVVEVEADMAPSQATLVWNAYANLRAEENAEYPDAQPYERTSMYMAADDRFMGYIETYVGSADIGEWEKAAILSQAETDHETARHDAFDADFMNAGNYDVALSALSNDLYTLVESQDVATAMEHLGGLTVTPAQPPFDIAEPPTFIAAYEVLKENNPTLARYVEARTDFTSHIREAYEDMGVKERVEAVLAASEISWDAKGIIDKNNTNLVASAESFYADLDRGEFPLVARGDLSPTLFDSIDELEAQQPPVMVAALTEKFGIPESEIILDPPAPLVGVPPALTTNFNPASDIIMASFMPAGEVTVEDLPPLPSTEPEITIAAAPVIPVEVHDLPPLEMPATVSSVAYFKAAVANSEIIIPPAADQPALWGGEAPVSVGSIDADIEETTQEEVTPTFKDYTVHGGDYLGKIIGREYGLKPGDVGYQETRDTIAAVPENAILFEENARRANKSFDDYVLYPKDKLILPVGETAEPAPALDSTATYHKAVTAEDTSEIFKVKGSLSQTVWRAAVNEYHIDMTGLDLNKIYAEVGELNNLKDIGKVAKDQPLYIPRYVFEPAAGPV